MKPLLPLYCFLIAFVFSACNKSYEPPIPLLAGLWQESEPGGQNAGYTYRIRFAEDSTFRLYRFIFTDAVDPANPCKNSRTQYIQGNYTFGSDRLRLRGNYFDSSFSTQTPDCSGASYYDVQHSIKGTGKNLILDDEAGTYGRITLVPVLQ